MQGGHPQHEAYNLHEVDQNNHIHAEQAEEEVEDYLCADDQMQDDQPIYDDQVVMD